jgi:reverse gyrase
MRVYDYFRGTCPNCNGQIDRDHLNIKQDSIQTSLFSITPLDI